MVLREGREGAALEQLFARVVVEASKTRKGSTKSDNSLLDVEDSGESEAILKTVAKVEEVLAKLKKLKQERMDTLEDMKVKVRYITWLILFILLLTVIYLSLLLFS